MIPTSSLPFYVWQPIDGIKYYHLFLSRCNLHGSATLEVIIGRTQLLLPPTLNVAFRSFEPRIAEPFPNEKLLRKKKIAATERTIFHWETALRFTVQKIWMPCSISVFIYAFAPHIVTHNRRTQLLLPPILNVAFRLFEPWIADPFPNEKLFAR